jgi:hypothetical protein
MSPWTRPRCIPCSNGRALNRVLAIHWFLGLMGYYRHFIRDYRAITEPLTWLLCKTGFHWPNKAEATFHALQRALTMVPVLQLPDFDHDFVVKCDASDFDIGVVLHQGSGLVPFFSRQIGPHHFMLAAYEHELIDLVQTLRHWCTYPWGRAFIIKTHHYSLKYMLNHRLTTIPQHQWVSKLMGFDFTAEYKPGTSNTVADALSHHETEEAVECTIISTPTFKVFDDLQVETEEVADIR